MRKKDKNYPMMERVSQIFRAIKREREIEEKWRESEKQRERERRRERDRFQTILK